MNNPYKGLISDRDYEECFQEKCKYGLNYSPIINVWLSKQYQLIIYENPITSDVDYGKRIMAFRTLVLQAENFIINKLNGIKI